MQRLARGNKRLAPAFALIFMETKPKPNRSTKFGRMRTSLPIEMGQPKVTKLFVCQTGPGTQLRDTLSRVWKLLVSCVRLTHDSRETRAVIGRGKFEVCPRVSANESSGLWQVLKERHMYNPPRSLLKVFFVFSVLVV